MRVILWVLLIALLVLHQDYWQWGKSELVFGILPYTLAYHAALSLAAAAVWLLAVTAFWPKDLRHVKPVDEKKQEPN